MRYGKLALVLVAGLVLTIQAQDIKSGPTTKIGGPFDVKAITGERKGDELCYVCKYNSEARPAVVLIFTQKADDNFVTVFKAVDELIADFVGHALQLGVCKFNSWLITCCLL